MFGSIGKLLKGNSWLDRGCKWKSLLWRTLVLVDRGLVGEYPFLNCNTDNANLFDELITEIHRLTFRDMHKYQNDAAACHDIIIPKRVMLYSRKFNNHKNFFKLAVTTLHKTKYHVQTAIRTSPNYYTSTKDMQLYGSGQG